MAFFFTAGVTIGLTLYAMTTEKDITIVGATGFYHLNKLASILLSSFTILIFANLFFRTEFLFTVYLVVGAISYAYYLVFLNRILKVHHTQAIMGGKMGQVDLDDYIKAALTLYTDII